jgi:hypothetical protein
MPCYARTRTRAAAAARGRPCIRMQRAASSAAGGALRARSQQPPPLARHAAAAELLGRLHAGPQLVRPPRVYSIDGNDAISRADSRAGLD